MADPVEKKPNTTPVPEGMPTIGQALKGLVVQGDPVLDQADAEDIIAQRLLDGFSQEQWDALNFGDSNVFGQHGSRANRDIARIIVAALPEDIRTTTVLASMDVRPYLAALNGKEITGERLDESWTNLFGELGAKKDRKYKVNTQVFIDAETERIKAAIGVEDATLNAADKTAAAQADPNAPDPTEYNAGQVGVVPTPKSVAPSEGQGAAATAAATGAIDTNGDGVPDAFDPTLIAQGLNTKMPIEDMRTAVQLGYADLDALARQEEVYQKGDFPGQYFPVQVDYTKPKQSKTDGTVSADQAALYLTTLTPNQVISMQAKLAGAGYFDRLGNDGHHIKGDAYDENTVAAWKLLLEDTVKQKKPMPAVLGSQLRTYREKVREERLRNLSELDPSYSMALANEFGQSKLGRNLTTEELMSLNHHLESLRTARAGHLAGSGDNAQPLGDSQQGFGGSDVETYLGVKTEREQRIDNAQSLRFQLSKAMK